MRHKNISFLPKFPSRPTRIHAFGWGALLIFKLKYNGSLYNEIAHLKN